MTKADSLEKGRKTLFEIQRHFNDDIELMIFFYSRKNEENAIKSEEMLKF